MPVTAPVASQRRKKRRDGSASQTSRSRCWIFLLRAAVVSKTANALSQATDKLVHQQRTATAAAAGATQKIVSRPNESDRQIGQHRSGRRLCVGGQLGPEKNQEDNFPYFTKKKTSQPASELVSYSRPHTYTVVVTVIAVGRAHCCGFWDVNAFPLRDRIRRSRHSRISAGQDHCCFLRYYCYCRKAVRNTERQHFVSCSFRAVDMCAFSAPLLGSSPARHFAGFPCYAYGIDVASIIAVTCCTWRSHDRYVPSSVVHIRLDRMLFSSVKFLFTVFFPCCVLPCQSIFNGLCKRIAFS